MKKDLIAYLDPKSPITEIFRTLRTNIQFKNYGKPVKSLLITSTMPGEGKSWTAANLAITFAQTGKKVILVDADMRKGTQAKLFEIPSAPGLSNYLSGLDSMGEKIEENIQAFINQTEVENLSVMTAGNVPPNPAELLISPKLQSTVRDLKRMFDIVIFDTTPSILVTDAVILATQVDLSIIVTEYKKTKTEDLDRVKKEILNVGGRIAGVVINKVPVSEKEYENSYYYGRKTTSNKKTANRYKTTPVKSDIRRIVTVEDVLKDYDNERKG